jgi:hypothetical protein
MSSSDPFVQIQLDMPQHIYEQLLAKSQSSGKNLADLAIQGIEQMLRSPDISQNISSDRLAQMEIALENKLKDYVETRLNQILLERNLLTAPKNVATMPPIEPATELSSLIKPLPPPTIRSLQVGDRVLILDPDSPYYMARLLIIRTSLLRATVDTETGEKTFLKRDLRFIEG